MSDWRGPYLAIFLHRGSMAERLNLHIDETGNQDLSEGRYLVAVVLHDHSADIEDAILIFDSLSYFQVFDAIAVYYDNGQGAVSAALHDALDFVLAKNVADYRHADPNARRLLQVADCVCTVLRVSEDYDAGRQSKTHERFFGNRRNFTQSFKKQLDRKAFA